MTCCHQQRHLFCHWCKLVGHMFPPPRTSGCDVLVKYWGKQWIYKMPISMESCFISGPLGPVATPTTNHLSQWQEENPRRTLGLMQTWAEVVSISFYCTEATDRQQAPQGSWQDALARTNVNIIGSECSLKWLLDRKDIAYLNRRPAASPLFSFQQF